MTEFVDALLAATAWPHWRAVGVAVSLVIVGEIVKAKWLTKSRAKRSKWIGILRGTLAAHPILMGCLLGVVFAEHRSIGTILKSVRYYGAAGAMSVVGYSVIKALAMARGWPVPSLPGLTDPPPKMEDDIPTNPGKPSKKPPPSEEL